MERKSPLEDFPRGSGILLHVTSLPGGCGIGDLGPAAHQFIDFLKKSGQKYWQVLPLGPTDPRFDNSPYTSFSAFAGNPLLISPDALAEQGFLGRAQIEPCALLPEGMVDYPRVIDMKGRLLDEAIVRFQERPPPEEFTDFCERNVFWLDDYALFMAIKREHELAPWTDWPEDLKRRDTASLVQWGEAHTKEIHSEKIVQFFFHHQWDKLKRKAKTAGIHIIGDLPIYVSLDSADVWSRPEFFDLDSETLLPRTIAGVPPDYFSETGQLWRNPLYCWRDRAGELRADLLEWWVARLRHLLSMVDLARIDHFRGLEAYWEILAGEETAVNGHWVPGPGREFLEYLENNLGGLRLIAEDLGVITPEVEALRDEFILPGMKVLQFAFDGSPKNPYLTSNYESENCVVYTGTHDNDTTEGWYASLASEERKRVCKILKIGDNGRMVEMLVQAATGSKARIAIIPFQDRLGLGSEARLNVPGVPEGNWRWRARRERI